MANVLLTPTVIAKEALALLENNLVMGNHVHRRYKNEFKKVGGSITIRKPVKFKVTKSRAMTTSTVSEQSITLTVSTQAHVAWGFFTDDLTLTIEEYSERYIKPASAALANVVDADLCGLYVDVWNKVIQTNTAGTPFVDPQSFLVLGKAGQRLDEEAAPQEDRVVVLNPAGHWSMANALTGVYVTDVAGAAIKKGFLARLANMEVYMDQNIKVHNVGQYQPEGTSAATILLNTAGEIPSTGVTITSAKAITMGRFCVADTALQIGDVFTIAGVYAVNPVSGESTGILRQFVVTAAVNPSATATDSGNYQAVYFEPMMVASGPYKTIDTFPAAAAAVSVVGSVGRNYPQNLAFNKNAFALVTVPLEIPKGVWGARATHNGLSIRILKDYNILTDEEICRLDIMYGVKTIYPELACRIAGKEVT